MHVCMLHDDIMDKVDKQLHRKEVAQLEDSRPPQLGETDRAGELHTQQVEVGMGE